MADLFRNLFGKPQALLQSINVLVSVFHSVESKYIFSLQAVFLAVALFVSDTLNLENAQNAKIMQP